MTGSIRLAAIAAGVISSLALAALVVADAGADWSEEELAAIRSLALSELPAPPPDPSNRVADDAAAAALGEALFFDARFSANGKVSCASCHLPQRQFQDDLPLARGVGVTSRRTMPLAGTAHMPFLFWDGRKDSLWSQALGPLESAVEHGGDRTQYAHLVARHYRADYERVFGALPALAHLPAHAGPVEDAAARRAWDGLDGSAREDVTRIFANIGKAIAAFERRIQPQETRFDRYAATLSASRKPAGDAALTREEIAGLRLFIGKANCLNCHNGPLFTNADFHNTGVPRDFPPPQSGEGGRELRSSEADGGGHSLTNHHATASHALGTSTAAMDLGRSAGANAVKTDPFNCLGPYSDAKPANCSELRFMQAEGEQLVRAFKVPSLRGAATRPPYMHAGQIATLADVVAHYDRAPAAPGGHSELHPLGLTQKERDALVAFLKTLSEDSELQNPVAAAPVASRSRPASAGQRTESHTPSKEKQS